MVYTTDTLNILVTVILDDGPKNTPLEAPNGTSGEMSTSEWIETRKRKMQQDQPSQQVRGFDPRLIFGNPPSFRVGEGELIIGGDCRQVLGRMVACFLAFRNSEGRMCFNGVTVIAPPRMVWDLSDEAIHTMLIAGMEDMQGSPLPAEVANCFLARIKVHRCLRLDTSEVVTAIAAAGEGRVILVPDSSKYRDPRLKQEWKLGRSGALLPEDIWVPHTASMAAACLAAAKSRGSVVIFSAPEEALVSHKNIQLLNEVEELYPVILGYEGEPDTRELLSSMAPRWLALASAGHAHEAFHELEKADFSYTVKRQVALQVAARAGDRNKTLALLHEYLEELDQLPGDAAARMGRLAYTFGDTEAALRFLAAGLDNLSEQMWLEVVLNTLTSLGAPDLTQRSWNRLQALFPHSSILEENRDSRLLQACEAWALPTQMLPSRAGFEDFHHYVADALYQTADVDHEVLMEHVRLCWADRVQLAALCVARHALRCQNLTGAINFAVTASNDARYEPQAVRVLLGALRRMFLLEIHPRDGMEAYKKPLSFILRYLARHPDEARLRTELGSALAVEAAGSVGLPVLASFALDVTALGTQLQETPPPAAEPADEDRLRAFFTRTIKWMAEQRVIEPGVSRLPTEMVGDDPGGLIAALEVIMRHSAQNQDTPEDLQLLERCAYMVCLLSPYVVDGSADLDALRLLGVTCWQRGQPQRARDIAEQLLSVAGESDLRQRVAWGYYADIYQRTRSPIDALIGLTCAALTNARLSAGDLFQEAYTFVRVARDLHLYDIARTILRTCRRLYAIHGLGTFGLQRLDGIEIALDVAQSRDLDEPGLLALAERARAHCERVMQGTDDLLPSAAHFLQIAGTLERTGLGLPPQAVALRVVLNERFGSETAGFLKAISAPFPSIEEVVWLHNRLDAAQNSEDTATDQLSVVIAAQRLLLPRSPEISAHQAVVAVELLSDRAIELGGPARRLDAMWPAEFISSLSEGGLGVLMLATDSDGELVAVLAEQGELRLIRPEAKERTFEGRLNAWSDKYPYRYGLIEREEGNAEFYASMQQFDMLMPNTDRVLVVAQPALQQLAFNLILADGEFAGESKAIGLTPSLTWFDSARRRPSTTATKRLAWISCLPQSEAYGTLDMLFARLEPVFDKHGFKTDTSGTIPNDLGGASLAVVTAHGQLTSEQRYIHSIADEQKLTESPLALARALAGIELVILFICSGGRVD